MVTIVLNTHSCNLHMLELFELDFLPEQEIAGLLAELGVTKTPFGETCMLMKIENDRCDVQDCLTKDDCCEDPDSTCHKLTEDNLIKATCEAARRIHEGQTVLIPAGRWRSVFDAVAFSMASNEAWQEFDASATTMLNTSDPLLFESGDEQLMTALINALMKDGESVEQSLFLIPAGAPVLMHVQPNGPVRLWFGNQVLADEVSRAYKD